MHLIKQTISNSCTFKVPYSSGILIASNYICLDPLLGYALIPYYLPPGPVKDFDKGRHIWWGHLT